MRSNASTFMTLKKGHGGRPIGEGEQRIRDVGVRIADAEGRIALMSAKNVFLVLSMDEVGREDGDSCAAIVDGCVRIHFMAVRIAHACARIDHSCAPKFSR